MQVETDLNTIIAEELAKIPARRGDASSQRSCRQCHQLRWLQAAPGATPEHGSGQRLRRDKTLKLKVSQNVARAFTPTEKEKMMSLAKDSTRRKSGSPAIYAALTLALNAGMRDAEIRNLTWEQVDFGKQFLTVGKSKTDAGEGRTIPLNSVLLLVY